VIVWLVSLLSFQVFLQNLWKLYFQRRGIISNGWTEEKSWCLIYRQYVFGTKRCVYYAGDWHTLIEEALTCDSFVFVLKLTNIINEICCTW
jgi:hypothetical protein